MNVLLGGCGGTANVVVKKPKNTSLITPKLVSIEPRDNAITVKRNEKIVLKFSVPIDPLTLTVNTEDTQCSGTIQISSYNFRNCVRMNLPELEDGNKRIVLSPKGVYAAQEFHQIRLSTEIKAINGASLKKNLTTKLGFRTTWSQQIGTQGDDTGFAITVDKDGNVYLAGNTSVSESGEESDLFLAKYAPSGFLNWIHQPGFGRSVKAAVLRMKKSGQLSLSGLSQGKNNSAVIKLTYDVNGKKLSSKVIGISGTVSGNGMALDSEGHIYVSAASPFNLMKIRKTGEKMWATELNPGISLQAIAADSGTGLYLTGSMMRSLDGNKSTGGIDVFLLKMYKMEQSSMTRGLHWQFYLMKQLRWLGTLLKLKVMVLICKKIMMHLSQNIIPKVQNYGHIFSKARNLNNVRLLCGLQKGTCWWEAILKVVWKSNLISERRMLF